jgi:hypothetical protein
MCGAPEGDRHELSIDQHTVLREIPKWQEPNRKWVICNECREGIAGLSATDLPKPDRIHLLSQVRRATLDDQEAVLQWLLTKFGLQAVKKTP